ncbi:MAG: hypothetical protein AUG51_11840 [Acidobacteria bacterium 13_1_20CM_3_53_8]|nr:MAG: hypothetical protein AUG51_11840 [Acidobacteria bacterium 13_1_20CM_3_53_8]
MSATAPEKVVGRERGREQGRVLLVSESATSALYREALEDAGLNVVGVSGGAAALISLRRSRPHVVVADICVKGISAAELVRSLRQTQDALPLVFVGDVEATRERRRATLEAGAFDYFQIPDELPLLIARARQLIGVQQRIDRLRAEADRDYLTGLANRRRFRTALGQEVERWRRYNVPCSLLLADIDYLKRINDAHGHSAGDRVIRHVASALTEASRDNDTAARMGGEEFALLLAGADEASAMAAAERLRIIVAAEAVEGVGIVTVSLGVASCPVHAETERSLYAASDAALYRAKNEGRNRTAIAGN